MTFGWNWPHLSHCKYKKRWIFSFSTNRVSQLKALDDPCSLITPLVIQYSSTISFHSWQTSLTILKLASSHPTAPFSESLCGQVISVEFKGHILEEKALSYVSLDEKISLHVLSDKNRKSSTCITLFKYIRTWEGT